MFHRIANRAGHFWAESPDGYGGWSRVGPFRTTRLDAEYDAIADCGCWPWEVWF